MEIKKHLADPNGQGSDVNPIEVAERLREIFVYLMEVQI